MSAIIEFKAHDGWALFVSIFGGIVYGLPAGVIAGILGEPRWVDLSAGIRGTFSASILYGVAVGAILPVFLSDIIGRKLIFIISGFISFVFTILLAFMNSTVSCIIMRSLSGIGAGMIATMAPAYTGELSSLKWRGVLVSLVRVTMTGGVIIGYLLNIPFNYVNDGWRYEFVILKNAGVQNRLTLLLLTLVVGVWNCLTSTPNLFLLDRLGRKKVLIFGSIVQTIGMFFIMLSNWIPALADNGRSYYMAIPGIVVYLAGYEVGIGPLFMVMIAEMFPETVTSAVSSLMMTIMWVSNLIIVTVYSPLSKAIGDRGVFIITFVLSFSQVIFSIFAVKDTKGMHKRHNQGVLQEDNNSNLNQSSV
ncbi:MAG: hypothetical protein EZS28_007536 [Streblomastix strix]|uniref:Major facilitator superfamily (MFS) profile domain-containing protein n=1 Tax=Streblomastix strix TaxID=222440 RepID=A0A5J4WQV5_9EUKA|nr:MAG: hypothetical protein EZS28_007536 [Streblomastix strix]